MMARGGVDRFNPADGAPRHGDAGHRRKNEYQHEDEGQNEVNLPGKLSEIAGISPHQQMRSIRQRFESCAQQGLISRFGIRFLCGEVAAARAARKCGRPLLEVAGNRAERRIGQQIYPVLQALTGSELADRRDQLVASAVLVCRDEDRPVGVNGAVGLMENV
jgi:hypothetical protein